MFNFFRQSRTSARSPEAIPLVEHEKRPQRRICKSASPHESEFQKFPRFGPWYSVDEAPILKGFKEAAWEHVLDKTEGDRLEITEKYLSAIRDVEREAIDCYADVTEVVSETEFRWMMLKDGCLLIQLAILILGGSAVLGYPKDHVIFGRSKINDTKRWLKSMFYVGNQIPLVILWKLMEQPFFQQVLSARVWEEPSDLLKGTLYELLLFPSTGKRNSSGQITFPTALQGPNFTRESLKQRPSDLLHGLQSFVICTVKKLEDSGEEIDLEIGYGEEADDDKEFSSVTELSQAGIRFKNVKGMGNRGIYLESGTFRSVLFMPSLTFDDDTELIFQYLKSYEMAQQPNGHKRQVCAYLKLMSEFVRTKEDVKLLADEGIINADPIHKDKLPTILRRLASGESSQNLRHLRLQINEYSRPSWWKYKELLSIVFFLTVLQTVFSVLSYVHDVKS